MFQQQWGSGSSNTSQGCHQILFQMGTRDRNNICRDRVVTAVVEHKFVVEMRVVLWSVSVIDVVVIAVTAVGEQSEQNSA